MARVPLRLWRSMAALSAEDAGEGGDSEGGVGVRVARGPGVEALSGRSVGYGLLGVSGHGVVLGVGAEHGAAGAVGGYEGGGHFAGAAFHLEALGFEKVAEGVGGAVLPPGGFGVVPDLAMGSRRGFVGFGQPIGGRVVFRGRCWAWGWSPLGGGGLIMGKGVG